MIDRFNLERTSIAQRYEKIEKNRAFTLKMFSGERGLLKHSRDTAIDIICAIAHNKTFSDIMNLPNKGQISNLPLGAVVETMGCIREGVFEPIAYGALPEVLCQLVGPHCVVQKMTLAAALSGNRKMALDALQIDPSSSALPPSDIRRIGEELLEANRDYLDFR